MHFPDTTRCTDQPARPSPVDLALVLASVSLSHDARDCGMGMMVLAQMHLFPTNWDGVGEGMYTRLRRALRTVPVTILTYPM